MSALDMSGSIEARSDQINADDLVGGPATYTIREVINGKAEAPFDFLLVETDRAYRPSKTMRRMIVACLGPDTSSYPGVRITVYREPSIVFGGKTVGGIRVSHISGIDAPVERMLQTTRGKREKFVILPLPQLSREEVLQAEWKTATPERQAEIKAEVEALRAGATNG